jgi:hypothetical protein
MENHFFIPDHDRSLLSENLSSRRPSHKVLARSFGHYRPQSKTLCSKTALIVHTMLARCPEFISRFDPIFSSIHSHPASSTIKIIQSTQRNTSYARVSWDVLKDISRSLFGKSMNPHSVHHSAHQPPQLALPPPHPHHHCTLRNSWRNISDERPGCSNLDSWLRNVLG